MSTLAWWKRTIKLSPFWLLIDEPSEKRWQITAFEHTRQAKILHGQHEEFSYSRGIWQGAFTLLWGYMFTTAWVAIYFSIMLWTSSKVFYLRTRVGLSTPAWKRTILICCLSILRNVGRSPSFVDTAKHLYAWKRYQGCSSDLNLWQGKCKSYSFLVIRTLFMIDPIMSSDWDFQTDPMHVAVDSYFLNLASQIKQSQLIINILV